MVKRSRNLRDICTLVVCAVISPDHHQRQPAHAGIDQRIDAVEHDGERAGGQAEGDADDGDEQGDGDRGA
ncbi:hypothetical protein PPS11_05507 [Pseudomonas putida S11]|nr:hypothetical protein PPS11_05507 [Pseudomonas putida S11]